MYKVALIGTGRVGYQFTFSDLPDNHAAAVAASGRCRLTAGVNRGRKKLAEFGARFGVKALYHDHRRMLAESAPDVCIVATHPELHCRMVEDCAAAPSTRAIICEKPMALSLGECDRMIAACERAGVLLQINHNRRWHPEWIKARELLAAGAIGALNYIECSMDGGKPDPSWRSEREGPLLHDFSHYFDLLDLFAGPVEWLCGMAEQRSRPWAVEDFSAAFIKFASGVTAVMHGAELTDYEQHSFLLSGSTGVIRMEAEQVRLFRSQPGDVEADSGFAWRELAPAPVARPAPASTYTAALDELLDALEGGAPASGAALRSDGRAGRRSLEMIMAIYRSQLDGNRPVAFPVTMAESGVEELRAAGQFVNRVPLAARGADRPADEPARAGGAAGRGPSGCCICGLQFGDEGKGQIVDYLAGGFDVVVRYNGGANAGHSVWMGARRTAFHLMPSGILRDGVLNVIGNGTAVDPAHLIEEIDALRREGYAVDPDRLAISDRAHVVMPYHKIEDELMDRAFVSGETGELGTTRRGIGPCYADKAHRVTAVRMADVKDPAYLQARLPRLVAIKNGVLGALAAESGLPFEPLESDPLVERCAAWAGRLAPYVTDTADLLVGAWRAGRNILFEGAHAALLDVDFGTYPYCTSSVCSPGGALAGTGLAADCLGRIVGVAKLYMSRVGAGPFPTEIRGAEAARVRDAGNEYGTSTGRPRRIGWLDLVALRHTARVTGVTALAVTGLGVLSKLSELRVCVGYSLGAERIDRVPANVRRLADVQPRYEEMEPVGGPLDGVRRRADLPRGARRLLDRVESFVGVPIRYVCVSKGRSGVIG